MAEQKNGGRRYTSGCRRKGSKEKLVELAEKNAAVDPDDRTEERLKREEGRTIGAVKEIGKICLD